MIEVTVAEEDRLIDAYRKHLRAEARRLVADDPERVGKHYALVHFPSIDHATVYCNVEKLKVEWV